MFLVARAAPAQAPALAPLDVSLDAAQALIGRALFVRGFYVADDLSYDASGRVEGTPKAGEWTLAGIDIKKVERRGPKQLYLEGARVAIRYNQDNHLFERHPQNDERMRVLVADAGNVAAVERTLDAIFALGIDPRLQAATPPWWQHYFNPGLAWPQDVLTGQTAYATAGLPNPAKDVTPPVVLRQSGLKLTSLAEKDRVRGVMQLSLTVDAEGVPHRIAVTRPLGYGLEESAVESVSQWRFTPAMREGKQVAVMLIVNLDFVTAAPGHP